MQSTMAATKKGIRLDEGHKEDPSILFRDNLYEKFCQAFEQEVELNEVSIFWELEDFEDRLDILYDAQKKSTHQLLAMDIHKNVLPDP